MARKKKKEAMPVVTSAAVIARRTVSSLTNPLSPEEIKQRKNDMMNIVDVGLQQFAQALSANRVKMNSTLDLERLVKLAMILSGEPDSVVGQPTGQVETIEEFNLGTMLDENEDITNDLVRELYERYNEENDLQDR